MPKITFVRGNTRTPGIAARCEKIHTRTKATCTRKAKHAGNCDWSKQVYRLRPGEQPKEKPKKKSAITKLDCLQMIEDPVYRHKLISDLRERRLRPAVECMLWYYAKGKPKEMVEHSGTLSLQQELSALTPEELAQRARDVAAMLSKGTVPTVH